MKTFFLILSLVLFVCCQNNLDDVKYLYLQSISDDYAKEIEVNYYLDGKLEFQLNAAEMNQIKEPVEKSVFPQGVSVFVFNNHLDTIATILADFAVHDKTENIVTVEKNVELINLKNEQLHTERLFWDQGERKIYTDDFVTINTGKQIIMGYGFVTDQAFTTYSLSDITGTIHP
tara:strand:+ start:3845 stop:4366 length:522 start_codon:yes stop_codon:yes gene_type:complete